MVAIAAERVLKVHHWNDSLFSFVTTRHESLRFRNGQFVMVGLQDGSKRLMRAYSIASANHEETLEFFSIKVPNGPLTSKLQHLQAGDEVLISRKPTGTLVLDDLRPGRHLWFLSTGTGLAPFLSLIKDPEAYEQYEKIILVHGVRRINDLAYRHYIEQELPQHEYLGEYIQKQLLYFPTVTRESFVNQGRITAWLSDNQMTDRLGLPPLNTANDRFMLCGSPAMLAQVSHMLAQKGFEVSPQIGQRGDYVIERAFVEK